MKVETELLNQITNLVISLVIVLQITPWVLLLLGFFIMYIAIGFLVASITAVLSLATGAALIFIKQHKGLHSKLDAKGIFIYAYTRRIMYGK